MFDDVRRAVEAYFTQEKNNGTKVGGEVGNRLPGTEGGPCYQMQLKKARTVPSSYLRATLKSAPTVPGKSSDISSTQYNVCINNFAQSGDVSRCQNMGVPSGGAIAG